MAFAIRIKRVACGLQRGPQANGGEGVLQGTARRNMQMHIAGSEAGQAMAVGKGHAFAQQLTVVAATEQLYRQPQAAFEALAQEARVFHWLRGRTGRGWQPQQHAAIERTFKVR